MKRPTIMNDVPFLGRYLKMQLGDRKIAYLKESIRFDKSLIVSIENDNRCSENLNMYRYLKKLLIQVEDFPDHDVLARRYFDDGILFIIDSKNAIIEAFISQGTKDVIPNYAKKYDLSCVLEEEIMALSESQNPISEAFNRIKTPEEYWTFMSNWGHSDFIARQREKRKRKTK